MARLRRDFTVPGSQIASIEISSEDGDDTLIGNRGNDFISGDQGHDLPLDDQQGRLFTGPA